MTRIQFPGQVRTQTLPRRQRIDQRQNRFLGNDGTGQIWVVTDAGINIIRGEELHRVARAERVSLG